MSDEELLALAAKAIGLTDPSGDDDIWMDPTAGHYVQWNPLEDDGDALRLAVKLRFDLSQWRSDIVETGRRSIEPAVWPVWEMWGDDPCAATRRAIVRAAAAIGGAKG